ncbi:hypothetical protein DL765_009810 [Monosporascus sp. GIB2]|nr:hypothetical protein DL765_009810 [Monosporascus sp. GIB2]
MYTTAAGWEEKEPVDERAYEVRREALGEKHPDTIKSMAPLAATYHAQGRHDEAEPVVRHTGVAGRLVQLPYQPLNKVVPQVDDLVLVGGRLGTGTLG